MSDQTFPELLEVEDDCEAANDYLYANDMTDGLPVIPPTVARVDRAVDLTRRPADEVIGKIPPKWSDATIEKIAANAVMAGCKPSQLPALIAAVEAITDEGWGLYGLQATTNPVAPVIVVNGPGRMVAGFSSGAGAFGPGSRGNAAVGRALRLILMNVGGARPGGLDKSTLGFPGKFSMCFAENEQESPWAPFHVEQGFQAGDDVVTVASANCFVNVVDTESKTVEGLLRSLAGSVPIAGTNNIAYGGSGQVIVLMSPEHARRLSDGGFDKPSIREYIWSHGTIPLAKLSVDVVDAIKRKYQKPWLEDGLLRVTSSPDKIRIIVVGGVGPHSGLLFSSRDQAYSRRATPAQERVTSGA